MIHFSHNDSKLNKWKKHSKCVNKNVQHNITLTQLQLLAGQIPLVKTLFSKRNESIYIVTGIPKQSV